ncbi:MAG: hypothetical protein ABI578_03800 [Chloroflexota bacterium]
MSQVSIGRRAITAALSAMLLMTAASIPFVGIAGASTASTTCGPTSTDAPVSSSPYNTCHLDIRTPSSVRTGVAFTVQVAVTTDSSKSTVATSDPCGSKAPITLRLSDGESDISTQTVNANAGIATFSLTIAYMGSYDLFASGPGSSDASLATATTCGNYSYVGDSYLNLMAVNIPLDAPIAPCPPDTDCVQTTSGTGTQATLIADTGSTWMPKPPDYFGQPLTPNQCGTSVPAGATPAGDPNGVLGFTLTTLSPSPPTGVIILALNTVSKGIGQFNVCWSQPVNFMTAAGTFAMKGDLPNCKQRDQVAPCVLAKTSGQHNVGFLTILAPANLLTDPAGYGH